MRITSKVGGLAVAAAALGVIAAPMAQASPASPNIIGGQNATGIGYGAQVYLGGEFNCSGSVVAPEWVLTAAHCDGDGLTVKVGDLNLGKGEDANVTETKKANGADLLLLHLDHAVKASPVQLADADPANGDKNQIYGWGRTKDSDPASPVLKVATVQVTGVAGTDAAGTDAAGGKAITSKGVDGAAWHGDSGGPEVNANGQQVGVCSTGENSGHDNNGTQNYGSVANSRQWIKDTAGV